MNAIAVTGVLKGLVYVITLPVYAAFAILILAVRRLVMAVHGQQPRVA